MQYLLRNTYDRLTYCSANNYDVPHPDLIFETKIKISTPSHQSRSDCTFDTLSLLWFHNIITNFAGKYNSMKKILQKTAEWLRSLSFRTGVVTVLLCGLCYAISFLQMLLPISIALKGTLWVIFFGLAKTLQYTALLILGKAGYQRLRLMLRPRRDPDDVWRDAIIDPR